MVRIRRQPTDKRKRIGRLIEETLESKGLNRDGYYFSSEKYDSIMGMLSRNLSRIVNVDIVSRNAEAGSDGSKETVIFARVVKENVAIIV